MTTRPDELTSRRSEGPRRGAVTRWPRALLLGLVTSLAGRVGWAGEVKLLVFLHVALKQRAFQGELQAALAGIAVSAVGRVADFERALKDGQDAVLTLPVVMAAHGLTPVVRGRRKGVAEERYSLLGVDAAPDPARVASIGALDVLGREGMNTFVESLVGRQTKVERVTKVEDFLPLLQMQRVEAIVLPSRLVDELRAASRLNLVARELAVTVGLPALAMIGAAGRVVGPALGGLSRGLSAALGVDEWR